MVQDGPLVERRKIKQNGTDSEHEAISGDIDIVSFIVQTKYSFISLFGFMLLKTSEPCRQRGMGIETNNFDA